MKKAILPLFLIYLAISTFSCSSFFKRPEQKSETVVSDLFPENISRTQYYENLASGYSDNGQSDQASELLRLAILHDPKNLSARIKLASEYRKQKADYLAEVQLKEVLAQAPDHKQALHNLGDLYLAAQIYSKAEPLFKSLVQIDSSDARAQWALYFIAKAEKHFSSASTRLQQIEKLPTDQVSVVLEKASLFHLQKKWADEQNVLQTFYQNSPNIYSVVSVLSDSYFQTRNWDQAFSILHRYAETNDFNFDISEKLAFAAVQVQNYETALDEYAKQKLANPLSSVLDLKVAHVYFLMQQYELAEQNYLSYLKERSDDEAIYYLSKIYQLANRFDESSNYLKKIDVNSEYYSVAQIELANIEKGKDFGAALNRLAEAHAARPDLLDITKSYADLLIADHQFIPAIVLLKESIKEFSKDEDLRLKLAYAYFHVDNKKDFEKQMTAAIKINPKNSEIYSALAQLWFVKSKKGSDVEFFAKKAIELKSKNINLKPLLAWALLDQNKSAEAIALFEEFYEQNPTEYFYAKSLAEVYHYAYINAKAEKFSKIALALESNAGLNSVLQNKVSHKVTDFDTDEKFNSRVPASLQNY